MAIAVLFVAVSPARATTGPAHGRAWELVTPGPTNGVNFFGERAWGSDGDHVVFATFGPMPGAPSGDLLSHALASRTATGWTTQPIGEPFTVATPDLQASEPLAVSTEMSSWLWSADQPLLPGAPTSPDLGLYHRAPDGSLTLLGGVGNRNSFSFFGASEDVQHAVFQTQAHLVSSDAGRTSGGDAYEFAGANLRLVGVDSSSTPISACGSQVGDGIASDSQLEHPVSRDGTRIFFSAPSTGDCGEPRSVYMRVNGTQSTRISASQCTRLDCDAPQDATFAGALPDGSRAFLISGQQLTSDDVDGGSDLYRYDTIGGTLTRISVGPPGVAAGIIGTVVRASNDGARVYLLASSVLVPGEGEEGRTNLYVSDHGHLRFITTDDALDLHNAAVTPDGETIAFATPTALLVSDTDSNVDVYRYGVPTGTLAQVSTGSDGRGSGVFDVSFGGSGSLPPLDRNGMRYLSDDGRRVFFVTSESLLPEDVNDTADVYERADGVLGLVTSGVGDTTVAYGGASADGRSVFFATDETLVSADRNGGDQDLYDARLGGGFPDAPTQPPTCEEDACQGAKTPRLERPAPGSFVYLPLVHRFRILPLGKHGLARLAARGRITIAIDVPAAGRISLVARARVHGHTRIVSHSVEVVNGPARVRLPLQLSTAARGALARRGALRLTLVVRHSRLGRAPSVGLRLRSPG